LEQGSYAVGPRAGASARFCRSRGLLRQAHHTDRVIKGLTDGWMPDAITGLAAGMAGACKQLRIQAVVAV